jgi:NAD(P)-dependent dehydrogenase (short-subunit alcohol dehydrogenase family)
MNGLKNKVAIVAGGASGLGRATAIRLAEEGASVVVADINDAGARSVADSLKQEGANAEAYRLDISDESQVAAVVKSAAERFGHIDLLHNVAADLALCTASDHDILTTTLETFDRTLAVTLRGYVLMCREVIPHMIEAGGGAIVNTSSLAALRSLPTGNRYAYAIAKAGLSPLSQHIAVRYGMQNIRCNTAAMGMILSDNFLKVTPPERIVAIREMHRIPDPGNPDGLAAAIVYLLSDDARYVTGQTINIDCGVSAA